MNEEGLERFLGRTGDGGHFPLPGDSRGAEATR